jgi:hypothetical protein
MMKNPQGNASVGTEYYVISFIRFVGKILRAKHFNPQEQLFVERLLTTE